jgi:hypothetical protein
MNRNRLANGSEIEAAEAGRATRPFYWPRAPIHKSRRNALRCSALRLLTLAETIGHGGLALIGANSRSVRRIGTGATDKKRGAASRVRKSIRCGLTSSGPAKNHKAIRALFLTHKGRG